MRQAKKRNAVSAKACLRPMIALDGLLAFRWTRRMMEKTIEILYLTLAFCFRADRERALPAEYGLPDGPVLVVEIGQRRGGDHSKYLCASAGDLVDPKPVGRQSWNWRRRQVASITPAHVHRLHRQSEIAPRPLLICWRPSRACQGAGSEQKNLSLRRRSDSCRSANTTRPSLN